MGKVTDIAQASSWPVARLAREFRIHRHTLAKRIAKAGLEPTGEQRGNPTYSIYDVAVLLLVPPKKGKTDFEDRPTARKAWYQSENERIKFETAIGKLVPIEDVQRQLFLMAKEVVATLDRIPDVLERDAELEPEHVQMVEETIYRLRDDLRCRLVADKPETGVPDKNQGDDSGEVDVAPPVDLPQTLLA